MLTKVEDKRVLTDKAYDRTTKLVQLWLPASASLYFGLSQIWGLPAGAEVVGTIALVTTFLGVVLGVSQKNYDSTDAAYDGTITIIPTETGTDVKMTNIGTVLEHAVGKDSVKLKVKSDQ